MSSVQFGSSTLNDRKPMRNTWKRFLPSLQSISVNPKRVPLQKEYVVNM